MHHGRARRTEPGFEEAFRPLFMLAHRDTAFEIQLNEYDGDVPATVVEIAEVVLAGD